MFKQLLFIIVLLITFNVFAQSPHGKSVGGRDCSLCHVSNTWKVDNSKMKFSHDETKFKLTGQHNQVSCSLCHKSLDFSLAQTGCFSCHKDVHQNTVGADCQKCHTTNSWIVNNIQQVHQLGRFALVGVHRTIDCTRCHPGYNNLNFQPLGVTCYSCHIVDYNNAKAPDHIANHYSTDCESCHNITNIAWNTPNFQHDFFPLTSGHKIDCFACHKPNSFAGLSVDCVSCHLTTYNNTTNPNHTALKLSTDCKSCHTTTSFLQATFDHSTAGFVLTGAHATIQCSSCHKSGTTTLGTTCISCHQTNYNSASNHVSQNFPTDCTMCHSTTNWAESTFNHQATVFPLTGAHTTVQCSNCHLSGYKGTATTCISCHQTNYNSTTNPSHTTLALSTDCSTCHTTAAGWTGATFSIHNNYFTLAGTHTTLTCDQCHKGVYNSTSLGITCVSCHQTNYNNTTNPAHTSAGFGTDCQSCHTQNTWQGAIFNHDQQYFPIYSGSHIGLWTACSDCHIQQSNYMVFSCSTGSCHPSSATNNLHNGVQGYGYVSTQCLACHPKGSSGGFNHATSVFPLTGAHQTVNCIQCHKNGYPNTPTTCVGCHQTDYNGTNNPSHATLALSTDCSTCHTTAPGWTPALFPVHNTYFQLTGAHVTNVTCASCHTSGIYSNAPLTCVGCHQTDYNNTSNPSHKTLALSTDCSTCHTTAVGWTPALFPVHNTYFQLTGAHVTNASCASCHTSGIYSNAPITCVGCHQTDYNNTNNPSHSALAISTDCSTCHTTAVGWTPALFTVHNTYFQLTGAHITNATCDSCHTSGNYSNAPTTCVGCHQTDYNKTNNPSHSSLAYQLIVQLVIPLLLAGHRHFSPSIIIISS